ncbi:MAG: hypothetical protein R3296_07775 [Oleiphilaceae bacterium]|nr:hypothetical protein [Oleiphilaceae bacterium]
MWNNAGKTTVFATATLLLVAPLTLADDDKQRAVFKGEVTDRSTGNLAYTEYHEQQGVCEDGDWRIREHTVRYEDADGEVIATKELTYRHSQLRPSYTIEELRFDEIMQVTNRDDKRAEIRWQTMEGEEKTFTARIPSNGVIDAGFTALAGRNWETLVEKKEPVSLGFLASTRGKFYDFKVARTDSPEGMSGDYAFALQSTGWVTRWFVDDIIVGYNEQRQLTDYIGRTNIRREGNPEENVDGHIRYQYQQWPDCG